MPNNAQKLSNIEHPPAKMAGGMRVKQPDPHRTPLKAHKHEEEEEEDIENKKEMDREAKIDYDERRAQDLQTHTASAQAKIPKNPGTNAHRQMNNNDIQPRSFNH